MIRKVANLGGTASNVVVAKVAHGLMNMTWTAHPVTDEQAFESIISGIELLPDGAKMMLNAGEYYAQDFGTANLELLARFYEKYPQYAERTFLSVKGGLNLQLGRTDSSPENLRRSIDNVNRALRGTKRVDLFESGRVDKNIPIEEAIKTLSALAREGKFDHIGLSECSAQTLRRAFAIHPIAVAEIEVSPWSYEEETKKVISTAKELGVAIAAYSPLGHGFLTGLIKSPDDLPEDDRRRELSRFKKDVFEHNMAIVHKLQAIATRKNVTPAQLSIAWVGSRGEHVFPLAGSSHKKRTVENLVAGDIELTKEELDEIEDILAKHEIKGGRYFDNAEQQQNLWG